MRKVTCTSGVFPQSSTLEQAIAQAESLKLKIREAIDGCKKPNQCDKMRLTRMTIELKRRWGYNFSK